MKVVKAARDPNEADRLLRVFPGEQQLLDVFGLTSDPIGKADSEIECCDEDYPVDGGPSEVDFVYRAPEVVGGREPGEVLSILLEERRTRTPATLRDVENAIWESVFRLQFSPT